MMAKVRGLAPAIVGLGLLLTVPQTGAADPIRLDQSQPSLGGGAAINECCAFVAQTYTAGITGVLAAITIDVLTNSQPSPFPLHVAIRGVTNGLPDARFFGETTLSGPESPFGALIRFPQRIQQVSDTSYAIVVNYAGAPPAGPGRAQGGWSAGFGDPYPRGIGLVSETGASWFVSGTGPDMRFQTFVASTGAVPEPSALLLLVTGIGAIAGRARLSRRSDGLFRVAD